MSAVLKREPFADYSLGLRELKTLSLWKGVAGEFLASTVFLLSTISTYDNDDSTAVLRIALTFGFAIAVLVQAFGGMSGGHINSAVSFGLLLAGRCSVLRCILYTLAQSGGAITGVAITYGVMPDNFEKGLCTPAPSFKSGYAVLLEMFFAGILVLVVLSLTDPRRPAQNVNLPLNIGLAVFLSHLILVPWTGSAINPTRALGSAVIAGEFDDLWIYWVAGYLGAVFAALFYFLLSPSVGTGKDEKSKAVNEGQAYATE